MHNTIKLAAGLVTLLMLTPAAFAAPEGAFAGSRADVRAFCATQDAFLLEGGNFTLCVTPTTDVVCRDGNACASSNATLALAAGFKRIEVAALESR